MPRNYKHKKRGKTLNYASDQLQKALEATQNGMSIRKAAQLFKVPKSTLADRVSGRFPIEVRHGRPTAIPIEVEEKIVKCVKVAAERGVGMTRRQLMRRVDILCKRMQDEDDFEDFGGFEAAEPVQPGAQNQAGGVQAGPNPWAAAMFSPNMAGTRNVQPDLLCGQNRFPQHLDTPPTADVAISAEAGSASGDRRTADRQVNGAGFDPGLEFRDTGDAFDLDQVTLANDILDGSFRSSGGQSGAGPSLRNTDQRPNISGLDLPPDISNSVGRGQDVSVGVGGVVGVNNLGASGGVNGLGPGLGPGQGQRSLRGSRESSVSEASESRAGVSVSPQPAVIAEPRPSEEREGTEQGAIGGQDTVNINRDSSINTEENKRLKQDLEKQVLDNKKLTEDLARAHQLSEEAQKNYRDLKTDHEKQLEDLRQAGHQTLTVVVNEYKALLATTVAQQQETFEKQFVERLKEEAEKFQQILRQQKEEFDALQVEERRRNEEKLAEAVEEMRKLQQEKFDRQLAEELKKFEKASITEMEKEKEVLKSEIDKQMAVQEEKRLKILDEQKTEIQADFAKEVEKNKEHISETMKEQNVKFQTELSTMMAEERSKSQETMQGAVQSMRDGMNEYLEEQRQRDGAVQRRQLASLDLFLESARLQLQQLMSDEQTTEKEEKPS